MATVWMHERINSENVQNFRIWRPDGKDGIFMRDKLFLSPSGASDLVTGNNTGGNKMWKTETGVTLGEIIEQEAGNAF